MQKPITAFFAAHAHISRQSLLLELRGRARGLAGESGGAAGAKSGVRAKKDARELEDADCDSCDGGCDGDDWLSCDICDWGCDGDDGGCDGDDCSCDICEGGCDCDDVTGLNEGDCVDANDPIVELEGDVDDVSDVLEFSETSRLKLGHELTSTPCECANRESARLASSAEGLSSGLLLTHRSMSALIAHGREDINFWENSRGDFFFRTAATIFCSFMSGQGSSPVANSSKITPNEYMSLFAVRRC